MKRLREGEKMLVRSYKGYLKMLEAEIKGKSSMVALSQVLMVLKAKRISLLSV